VSLQKDTPSEPRRARGRQASAACLRDAGLVRRALGERPPGPRAFATAAALAPCALPPISPRRGWSRSLGLARWLPPGRARPPPTRGSGAPCPAGRLRPSGGAHPQSQGGPPWQAHRAHRGRGPTAPSGRVPGRLGGPAPGPMAPRGCAPLRPYERPCGPGAGPPARGPSPHAGLSSSSSGCAPASPERHPPHT